MKREFLEGLGLEKETVDKIMAENGSDLEREKAKTTAAKADLADVQGKLSAAQTELETLKKSNGDITAVQQQLTELQAKYDKDTGDLKGQLADRDYSHAIELLMARKELSLTSKGAERDFIAALKEKKLELKDGKFIGLEDFVKERKEEDPGAFAPDNPPPRFATGSGAGGGHGDPPKTPSRAAQLAAEHHVSLYGEAKKE